MLTYQTTRSSVFVLLALVTLFTLSTPQEFYRKVIHNTDPEAKCLDGSPAMLYIKEGTEKDKFMLYLIGGGFCGETTLAGTLQSCYRRSKTELGSSNYWPDFLNDQMGTEGLISLNEPRYQNWTKVLFAYCDGSMMQGGSDSPVSYKDTKLYFRGGRIMRSHFKYLINQYNMGKASKIMLTGGSAGGLASILWGNYLQSIVSTPSSVIVIPDSAIFINSTTFKDNTALIQQQISTLMQVAQQSQKSPISECNSDNPGSEWKCLFIEENHKYLKGRYLFINSQYDEWAISNILQIKCLQKGVSGYTPKNCPQAQMTAIQNYRNRYMQFIKENIMTNKNWSLWSIACSQHVYAIYKDIYNSTNQQVQGMTVSDAIRLFTFNDWNGYAFDVQGWPSNNACAY